MERNSFLAGLPFLIPCPTSSWPPPLHQSTTAAMANASGAATKYNAVATAGAVKSECLLQDNYVVSIEPRRSNEASTTTTTTNNSNTSSSTPLLLGPAFFGSSSLAASQTRQADPALTTTELVLEYTHSSSSSQEETSPPLFRYGAFVPQPQSSVLYTGRAHLKCHGGIFQLDLRHLQSVALCKEGATNDNSNSNQQQQQQHPASLVLQFAACTFCILVDPAACAAQDDSYSLQTVCTKLTAAALAAKESNAMNGIAAAVSPAESSVVGSSSATTTDQAALAEAGYQVDEATSISSTPGQKAAAADDNQKSDNPRDRMERRTQRRRVAYNQSLAGIETLEAVLNMPVSTLDVGGSASGSSNSSVVTAVVQDRVGPLLTAVGDHVAASYWKPTDQAAALQASETDLAACRAAVDEQLNAFFPLPRKKQRQSSKPAAKTDAAAGSVTEIPAQVQDLVQRQKEAVRKRHELFLLPSRG